MALFDDLRDALGSGYELGEELGGGGMSRLFLAREVALGRDVVVKVLPPEWADAVSAERFAQEAAILARLRHPHIVPILSAGAAQRIVWYVMPLVRGESLRARLERGGRLPLAEALALLRDAAGAVAYAHTEGVVHRDIKPANILLESGHAVLADFGIARAIGNAGGERLTSTGVAAGTLGYMAPEQIAGDLSAAESVDQYALGAVAYELLTGRPVFDAPSPQGLVAAHISDVPTAPHEVVPEVPPAVSAVVLRALAKFPTERFPSVAAFREALDEAAASAATGVRSLASVGGDHERGASGRSGPEHRGPTTRGRVLRTPVLAAVAGVALVLAATAAWFGRDRLPGGNAGTDTEDIVAVAPFDIVAPGASLLREGLVDLLARHFDGMGPLQTVAPSRSIRAWTADRADVESAVAYGRTVGAGLVIVGTVVPAGADSVRTLAQMVDVRTGRAIAEADRTEALDRVDRLADSLTVTLVAGLSTRRPGLAMRSTVLGSRDVGAIRSFLRGEAAYRAAQYDSAALAYQDARTRDSTFALAWLREVDATGFAGTAAQIGGAAVRERALRSVRANAAGLAPRDSALVVGWTGYTQIADFASRVNPADAIAGAAALQRAIERFPDDPSLRLMLGELQFHNGDLFTGLTMRDVAETFDAAVRADSGFLPAYEHLLELAPLVWGIERQRQLIGAYRARARDETANAAMGALNALAERRIGVSRLVDSLPEPVLLRMLPKLQYWLDEEEAALALVRGVNARRERERRPPLLGVLRDQLAMRGRFAELLQLPSAYSAYTLQGAVVDGVLPAAVNDSLMASWMQETSRADDNMPAAIIAAERLAVIGDSARFRLLTDAVMESTRAAMRTRPQFAAARNVMEESFSIWRTSRGFAFAGDTAAAAAAALEWPPMALPGWHRLNARPEARLLTAAGRYDDAFGRLGGVLSGYDLAGNHVLRARIAERIGRDELARESWELVVAAWQNADPALQPIVTEGRAALARLGASSEGQGRRVRVR